MNNAAAANTVKIATRSRTFDVLAFLLTGADVAALPAPAAELATTGAPCCAGNGDTLSTYLAPEETFEDYSSCCPDGFTATRTYYRRCR
jgi:hypothetical protein